MRGPEPAPPAAPLGAHVHAHRPAQHRAPHAGPFGARIPCQRFRGDLGPVGRWLARRGLDRLPLLLNVLRGEMALVGPRPETQDAVLRWHGLTPEYHRRFDVLPGLTGLAQLSGCPDQDAGGMARRIQYDLYYVDHRSLLLDVRTLVRTARCVFGGPGSAVVRLSGCAEREAGTDGRRVAPAPNAVKGVTP